MTRIWIVAVLWIAGCGRGSDPGRVIDLAPFGQRCASTGTCPAPYECVFTWPPSGPAYQACFVPCQTDEDCGDELLCNMMQTETADWAPYHHCYHPDGT
jgi:hypothetical protein